MHDISLLTLALLCLAAAMAGWIDAVVGGGLLQLPALLVRLPHVPAAHVLGTNKAVAVVGTSAAAVTYTRKAPVDVPTAIRIGLAAVAGSFGGAFFAAGINSAVLRPLIMVVLLAMLAFVLLRPTFGASPGTGPVTRERVLAAILVAGLGIGFYDGLIGPGTGTFLVIAFAAILHMDLVTASATTKVVNTPAPTSARWPCSPHRAPSCGPSPPPWPCSTWPAACWAPAWPSSGAAASCAWCWSWSSSPWSASRVTTSGWPESRLAGSRQRGRFFAILACKFSQVGSCDAVLSASVFSVIADRAGGLRDDEVPG